MDEIDEWLDGTGGAPLAATVRYSFRRVTSTLVDPRLEIPVAQVGTSDVCAYPEQASFVNGLIRSLGLAVREPRAGVWFFDDEAALATFWSRLATRLAEPDATVPHAHARRPHGHALDTLRTRFFRLVAQLLGLDDARFERRSVRDGDNGFEATSDELWQRGDVTIRVTRTVLESSQGIHGEEVSLSLVGEHSGKRTANAQLTDDARSGASCAAYVAGVRTAQLLADELVG